MGIASWRVLGAEDPEFVLEEVAGQSGLVSQLRPLITELSKPGDLVFDPFAGWGTTLVACAAEGRRGVGIEINPSRAQEAQQRVARYPEQRMLCGDARKPPLDPGTVDLVLCDLPYFGTELDAESPDPGQMYALRDYDVYLAALDETFAAVARVMRPGAYAVVAVQNRRLADRFVPLAWDAARVLGRHLTLGDERVHLYDWPVEEDDPMRTNRSHEYLLMAQK
ncbi:TRM11 family SAM-dependent methyltransferase [Streptomyces cacaoi]|uniref:TRM11 family SAM-dependent methyltransferase n=1 Tax=Streptomyces cacaoi TaxID=1898 RepID=UPI0037497DDB